MIFGKSKRKDFSEQIILDSIPIDEKPEVKYLGVHIDSNLTFQEEVKHILGKMSRGIKTIYAIRKSIPQKLLILVLNALVLSHLHYSAVIIHAIEQNLMSLEKQLNWSLRATFFRQKFESVQDIKCSRNILPVKLFLKTKRLQYFWKIKKQLRPAFSPTSGRPLITWNLHESIRTKKLFWDQKNFLYQKAKLVCFVRLAILDWNELPSEIKIKQDKKVSPSNLELSSPQLTKGTLFCGRLLVQHGVTLNLENELELLFTGWVDFINLINFYFEICDII